MNKKIISAAVLLGLSGTASAVNVSADGLGQLLLYPYYTAREGLSTDVVIVNTTNQAKAVKVRFVEGDNSWETFDFNLYLSPYDVWSGGVTLKDNGPLIYTNDTSCTLPAMASLATAEGDAEVMADQTFKTTNIVDVEEDTADNAASRIQEGYVEVIEMGNLADVTSVDTVSYNGSNTYNFFNAVQHVDGTPTSCDTIELAWGGTDIKTKPGAGIWTVNGNVNVTAPTGGLFGIGIVTNVAGATQRAYDAVALDNVYQSAMHSKPGTLYPDLSGAYVVNSETVPVTATYANTSPVTTDVFTGTGVTTTSWDGAGNAGLATMQAITAALQTTQINNYYYANAGLGASTEWVVTFPTKHEFVNASTASADGKSGHIAYGTAVAPFSAGANVTVDASILDNEETLAGVDLDFSPGGTNVFPYEVNVIKFTDKDILSSQYASGTVDTNGFTQGWGRLRFNGYSQTDANGVTVSGLPAIGFSTTQVFNGDKSYSTLYSHKYTRVSAASAE